MTDYTVTAFSTNGPPAPQQQNGTYASVSEARACVDAEIARDEHADQFGAWVESYGSWNRVGPHYGFQIEEVR